MKRTSFRLPEGLHEELRRQASGLGISLSDLIRSRLADTYRSSRSLQVKPPKKAGGIPR